MVILMAFFIVGCATMPIKLPDRPALMGIPIRGANGEIAFLIPESEIKKLILYLERLERIVKGEK